MAINKSIKKRTAALSNNNDAKELRVLYEAALADLAAQRTAFVALTAKLDVLTAKLNADAGVTDTNYATNFASTLDPVALTLTA